MKKFFSLLSLCIIFAMQSCSSDQEPTIPESQEVEPASISHMVVKFEGKTYETEVVTFGDSVAYLNKEYAELYRNRISKLKEPATIFSEDEDGTIHVEYFLSEADLLSDHKIIKLEKRSIDNHLYTRSDTILPPLPDGYILARAELFDDRKFEDRVLFSFAATIKSTAIPNLKELGFNDKASSIKVFNLMTPSQSYLLWYTDVKTNTTKWDRKNGSGIRPVLSCYHNSNFGGAVLYCIAPPTGSGQVHEDRNLKKIGWNDRISSIAWALITDFSRFEGKDGKDPEIPGHDPC